MRTLSLRVLALLPVIVLAVLTLAACTSSSSSSSSGPVAVPGRPATMSARSAGFSQGAGQHAIYDLRWLKVYPPRVGHAVYVPIKVTTCSAAQDQVLEIGSVYPAS